jgi:3-(3-hydroxy-phenyl)propionate hydroxylase
VNYDGKLLLASFDHALLKDETRHPWVLQCEQDKLARALFEMAKAVPGVAFRTETKVIGCAEHGGGVEVTVETADGECERHFAPYLVGADGARQGVPDAHRADRQPARCRKGGVRGASPAFLCTANSLLI